MKPSPDRHAAQEQANCGPRGKGSVHPRQGPAQGQVDDPQPLAENQEGEKGSGDRPEGGKEDGEAGLWDEEPGGCLGQRFAPLESHRTARGQAPKEAAQERERVEWGIRGVSQPPRPGQQAESLDDRAEPGVVWSEPEQSEQRQPGREGDHGEVSEEGAGCKEGQDEPRGLGGTAIRVGKSDADALEYSPQGATARGAEGSGLGIGELPQAVRRGGAPGVPFGVFWRSGGGASALQEAAPDGTYEQDSQQKTAQVCPAGCDSGGCYTSEPRH